MIFFANLGVNLHVCLCGDLEVGFAQSLDFLDIGKPWPTAKRWDSAREACEEKILIFGLETGLYREIISGWTLDYTEKGTFGWWMSCMRITRSLELVLADFLRQEGKGGDVVRFRSRFLTGE